MKQEEKKLHLQICKYLKLAYPNAIFTTEASGLKLTMGLAIQMKQMRSNKGLPDLLILEPRGKYSGLFLEIKTSRSEVYLKDGRIRSKEHVVTQNSVLKKLRERGYWANFVFGFDMAKQVIDNYLAEKILKY